MVSQAFHRCLSEQDKNYVTCFMTQPQKSLSHTFTIFYSSVQIQGKGIYTPPMDGEMASHIVEKRIVGSHFCCHFQRMWSSLEIPFAIVVYVKCNLVIMAQYHHCKYILICGMLVEEYAGFCFSVSSFNASIHWFSFCWPLTFHYPSHLPLIIFHMLGTR